MSQTSDSAKNKKWLKLAIVPALLAVLGFVLWSNQTSTPSESCIAPTIVAIASPTVLVKSTPKSDRQLSNRSAWHGRSLLIRKSWRRTPFVDRAQCARR